MDGVVKALESLSKDELLQMDLKDGEVLAAIDHWTGKARLAPEEAEARFNDNYQVIQVLNKLKMLQSACRDAGIALPLKALLAGSSNPFYGLNDKPSSFHLDAAKDIDIQEDVETKNIQENVENKNKEEGGREEIVEDIQDNSLSIRQIAFWWSVQMALLSVIMTQWVDWGQAESHP